MRHKRRTSKVEKRSGDPLPVEVIVNSEQTSVFSEKRLSSLLHWKQCKENTNNGLCLIKIKKIHPQRNSASLLLMWTYVDKQKHMGACVTHQMNTTRVDENTWQNAYGKKCPPAKKCFTGKIQTCSTCYQLIITICENSDVKIFTGYSHVAINYNFHMRGIWRKISDVKNKYISVSCVYPTSNSHIWKMQGDFSDVKSFTFCFTCYYKRK